MFSFQLWKYLRGKWALKATRCTETLSRPVSVFTSMCHCSLWAVFDVQTLHAGERTSWASSDITGDDGMVWKRHLSDGSRWGWVTPPRDRRRDLKSRRCWIILFLTIQSMFKCFKSRLTLCITYTSVSCRNSILEFVVSWTKTFFLRVFLWVENFIQTLQIWCWFPHVQLYSLLKT